jgi:hypothetical protein
VGASRAPERRAAIKQAIVAAAKDSSPVNCVGLMLIRTSMLKLMAHISSPTQV